MIPLELTDQERTVTMEALQQWAEEYATVEQHAVAHRVARKLAEL